MTRVQEIYPDGRLSMREVGLPRRAAIGEDLPVNFGQKALGP